MVNDKRNPINLKNAIFMPTGLDSMDPKVVKSMKTKAKRYNTRAETLMTDPFAYETKKGRGKK